MMLGSEEEWKAARRRSRWGTALGVLALSGAYWFGDHLPIDSAVLWPALVAWVTVSLLMDLWMFRKPRQVPSEDDIARIEKRSVPVMAVSMLCTWVGLALLIGSQLVSDTSAAFWPLVIGGFALMGVSLLFLPSMINHSRLSRVVPALNDERSRANLDRAYRKGFDVMFQVSFLGGLALMWTDVSVPPHYVAMGIGIIGIFTVSVFWCWWEWRDGA